MTMFDSESSAGASRTGKRSLLVPVNKAHLQHATRRRHGCWWLVAQFGNHRAVAGADGSREERGRQQFDQLPGVDSGAFRDTDGLAHRLDCAGDRVVPEDLHDVGLLRPVADAPGPRADRVEERLHPLEQRLLTGRKDVECSGFCDWNTAEDRCRDIADTVLGVCCASPGEPGRHSPWRG
nr:hypothetical protein [Streptomyces mesophilus]